MLGGIFVRKADRFFERVNLNDEAMTGERLAQNVASFELAEEAG